MATWKKVIVSGSAGEFTSVTSSVLTNDNLVIAGAGGALENSGLTYDGTTLNLGSAKVEAAEFSGSFSGSFQGDGSGLTGVSAQVEESLLLGDGLLGGTFTGQTAVTASLNTGSAHFEEGVRKQISVADTTGAAGINLSYNQTTGEISGSLVNSSITLGTTTVDLGATETTLDGLTLTDVEATGSFTGSFVGDGSGLTGLATTLDVSASNGSGISIDLLTQDLTITGTANEIETSAAGTTLTIGLPDDVTIQQDLTVSRNLTVFGTASFQQTTNLDVADRFILMASGSNAPGDGGIVIQQGTQGIGEAFGYDNAVTRWGVTGSFDGSQATFTPDAFMAAVVVGAGTDPSAAPTRYVKEGNIFVGTDESIYIYS